MLYNMLADLLYNLSKDEVRSEAAASSDVASVLLRSRFRDGQLAANEHFFADFTLQRASKGAAVSRPLFITAGSGVDFNFPASTTGVRRRHTGGQVLTLAVQTLVVAAHPSGIMVTPFGAAPYDVLSLGNHGVKRGALIEAVLAGHPLPVVIAHAMHTGWGSHAVYQTVTLAPSTARPSHGPRPCQPMA